MEQIPYGYCYCGCGKQANLAVRTSERLGYLKGEPMKYLVGHHWLAKAARPVEPPNPSGLCQCGCGKTAPIATYTSHQTGNVKGQHKRFCVGHGGCFAHTVSPQNHGGICMCGCGEPTKVSALTRTQRGYAAGQPMNFLHNHHGRRPDYVVEDRGHETPCWIWQKYRDKNGYGLGTFSRRHLRAHRWYYERTFGAVPHGFDVDHLCRVPSCVNPDHLSAVPPIINQQRKRTSKLGISDVAVIRTMRDSGEPFAKIAAHFGVNHQTIRNAYLGITWRSADIESAPPVS